MKIGNALDVDKSDSKILKLKTQKQLKMVIKNLKRNSILKVENFLFLKRLCKNRNKNSISEFGYKYKTPY